MEGAPESAGWALKLVELLLVFGGVVAFGVWQLRDVERARRESARARAAQGTREPREARNAQPADASVPPTSDPLPSREAPRARREPR